MNRYRIFQAVSATILVAGLAAAIVLFNTLLTRERQELQYATDIEARHLASQLQQGMANSVEPLRRLGLWWLTQGKPFDLQDWRTDGRLFLSRSPGLRQAAWVDARGRQLWSAAPGSDPSPMDAPPEAAVQRIIEIARVRPGSMAMSPLFDLPGGAAGFYVCVPVAKDGRVRGYVIGLYDAAALVSSVAENEVRPDSRVSISSGGREIYSTSGGGGLWSEESARADVELMSRIWTVSLRAPLNYFREFKGLILSVGGVIGALLYSFGMLLLLARRRSSALERANDALNNEVRRRMSSEAEVLSLNRELTRKVAEFQTLLEVIPIGIAVAEDPECRVVRPNRALAAFLGVPREANISRTCPEAAPYRLLRNGEEVRPEELPMRRAAAMKRDLLGEEYQVERPDGRVIDALAFASPIFDENGGVRGVLKAFVDITERKSEERLRRELEQRLQRAERMQSLGVMAAGIAHDFNNLLTGIIGPASLAAEIIPQDAEAQSHIASALEAAQSAATLVNKVLAYTGQSYHLLRPTDLGEIVRESRPSLLSLAGNKADLQFHIAASLPPVMADPDEIRHALFNIVLNAVEATKPGRNCIEIGVGAEELRDGEAQIAARPEKLDPGLYARIEVRDNGVGMPLELAEKAFDPFFTTKFLGRGLGLSEVLGIMRSHYGGVRMETAPDAGTSVKLYFPARLGQDETRTG